MSTTHSAPSKRLSDVFLLVLLLIILGAAALMFLPYLGPLLFAAVVAIVFYPVHLRISHKWPKQSPTVHALTTDLLVLLLLIIPAVFLIWNLINETKDLGPRINEWQIALESLRDGNTSSIGVVRKLRTLVVDTLGIQPAIFKRQMISIAGTCAQFISLKGAELAKDSVIFIVNLFIMLLSLFFFFRDGHEMVRTAQRYIPLRADVQTRMIRTIHRTTLGIVRGWFLTSLAQGLVATVGYLIIGAPAVALLGFLTAFAGLIPAVGTALVWLPVAICYLLQGSYYKGIFLMAWGTLVVGVMDNFLRPYLVGTKIDLPFLVLFFALFGGIAIWGFKGILLGPLFMALVPVFMDEYRKRYAPNLDSSEK